MIRIYLIKNKLINIKKINRTTSSLIIMKKKIINFSLKFKCTMIMKLFKNKNSIIIIKILNMINNIMKMIILI